MDVSANTGGGTFVVGVDFGTLSARALVVRVSTDRPIPPVGGRRGLFRRGRA